MVRKPHFWATPDPPILAFLEKARFFFSRKSKGFSLRGTPKILGKETKNAQKSKENRKTHKKSKEIEKKQGKKEGQGHYSCIFRPFFSHFRTGTKSIFRTFFPHNCSAFVRSLWSNCFLTNSLPLGNGKPGAKRIMRLWGEGGGGCAYHWGGNYYILKSFRFL